LRVAKEIERFDESGSTAILHGRQPIPIVLLVGSEHLTERAGAAEVTQQGITAHVSHITSALTHSSVVSLRKVEHEQGDETRLAQNRDGRHQTKDGGEQVGDEMVNDGALLLLTGGQHLGRGAGTAAGPAHTAVGALGRIAGVATARSTVAHVEKLIGAVAPVTIQGETRFTIHPHPLSLVLCAQASVEPRNELNFQNVHNNQQQSHTCLHTIIFQFRIIIVLFHPHSSALDGTSHAKEDFQAKTAMWAFSHDVRTAENFAHFAKKALAAEVFLFHFPVEDEFAVITHVAPGEATAVEAFDGITNTGRAKCYLPLGSVILTAGTDGVTAHFLSTGAHRSGQSQ